MKRKLKSAILGFGGMGHCHAAQYASLKNVELAAVCDIDPAQLKKTSETINLGNMGSTDVSKLHAYSCYEELVKGEPDLDMIDICLPSDLHAAYTCRAMKDGFHVLCEKPMALNRADCLRMIRVSKETGKKFMIAQVVRFDPRFAVIRDAVRSRKYGRLLRLVLHRNGSLPTKAWFRDVKRSGGAMMDLHIHDLDFIVSVLGVPDALVCFGSEVSSGGIDDMLANYSYPDGVSASSESSWTRGKFAASAVAVFEHGTLDIGNQSVTLFRTDKKEKEIPFKNIDPYGAEIDYFAGCVLKGTEVDFCMPESTMQTIRLIEHERKSAYADGRRISP